MRESHRRPIRRPLAVLLCAALAGSSEARSQETPAQPDRLAELLQANRHPLRLEDGRLTGEGASRLVEAARAAEVVALGEDHGVAEIPQLAAALFERLVGEGYRHLVIETSPLMARRLERAALGDGPEPVLAWQRDELATPLEVPFYSWREEAALLERAVRAVRAARAAGDSTAVLWGVDQEFIGSSRGTLAWLASRAGAADARRLEALADEAAAGMRAAAAGRQNAVFLASAADSVFDVLGAAAGDPEARAVADDLRRSREIYRLFFTGENYRSNLMREQLIKRTLEMHRQEAGREADRRGAGGAGKALVKLGADHLPRGNKLTSPLLSVGAYLSETALARGAESFHVLVVGGPGTRSTGVGPGMAFVQTQQPSGSAPWMEPVAAQLLPDGWTLFDLRPLRPLLAQGRLRAEGRLAQVVHGFDALVVLTGSTPASF